MAFFQEAQIWSAVPTPLDEQLHPDESALELMIEASIQDGVNGLFLAGTCGEGPWLPDADRLALIRSAVRIAAGRVTLAVQVTDNSAERVRENILRAADAGAGVAIVAAPPVFLNATAARIVRHFNRCADNSPIPVGIYDLGEHRPIRIPLEHVLDIYAHPQVGLVKDSSGQSARMAAAVEARRSHPKLCLLGGDEFRFLEYADAGYDGVMFGGAVVTARALREIATLLSRGKRREAESLDAATRDRLLGIYGGTSIACWLTGLKYWMVRRGLFSACHSFLEYPLHEDCRNFIERDVVTHGGAVSAHG
jgi:dihydrodipicolinate synthase/N-acetylneuraminate lyase